MKIRVLFAVIALFTQALTGCSLSSMQKAEMDKTLEDFYVTRFEFGVIGNIDVATSKTLTIDGRTWNFSELLASVFQEAVTERGISVGKLIPTKGGAYLLDELRVTGRTLILSVVWHPSGHIRTVYFYPRFTNAKAIKPIAPQSFADVSRHYETDEALYEGLKAELRPVVDRILDETLNRVRECGLDAF